MPEESKPDESKAVEAIGNGIAVGCLSLVAMVVGGMILIAIFSDTDDVRERTFQGSSGAIVACHNRMRSELMPGWDSDFPMLRDSDAVENLGAARYRLRSYVDSQGLDGQPFRYHYTCTVQDGQVVLFSIR